MSVTRPLVSVFDAKGDSSKKVPLPDVFATPIRTDIVDTIHNFAKMNLRHPHAVSKYAGHDYSAESWGTGRAVARIPRVSGGGTHRAGQAAFGNMCRGGRMFAPLKVWRRWAHTISERQKRYATASAIAASGVTALVMARGHKIDGIKEVPLVVSDDHQSIKKTKEAVALLKKVKAMDEVRKAKSTKTIRAGKGKFRGRKYNIRTGPLIVYKDNNGITKAFRNIPGVDIVNVNRLNLLRLAPGGHVGRFVIWTESALNELNNIFGSTDGKTVVSKLNTRHGSKYRLPRPQMANTDVMRIIDSDAVQNVVRPVKLTQRRVQRKNPLKNFFAYVKLNPNALKEKRRQILKALARQHGVAASAEEQKKAGKRQAREKKAQAFIDKVVTSAQ